MREFKFRVWDKRQGIWVSDKQIKKNFNQYYKQPNFVLMQSTGLSDKNGREIWDGDIVSIPYITPFGDLTEGENWRGVVRFRHGEFVVCYVSGEAYVPVPKKLASYRKPSRAGEYISNYGFYRAPTSDTILTVIDENPELLETEAGE